MVNLHRGEIEAVLNGKNYRLCLTLGALAELEHAFGEDDMLAIAERFEAGRIAATDAIKMIGAGLRGAGYEIDDDAVSAMRVEGGVAANNAAAPLQVTFNVTTNDAESFRRSEGQIAAMLSRMTQRGQRNL